MGFNIENIVILPTSERQSDSQLKTKEKLYLQEIEQNTLEIEEWTFRDCIYAWIPR